jgi:hypothetical protein
LSAAPPALTSRRPDLPPAVDRVIAKALAKAPGDRYDTCLGFASALQEACGLRPGGASPSAGPGWPLRSPTELNAPAPGRGAASAAPPPSRPPPPRPTSRDAYGAGPRPTSPRPTGVLPEFPPAYPPAKRPRSRLALAAVCIALLVLAAAATVALRDRSLLHLSGGQSPTPSTSASAPPVASVGSPATTVQRYISAINNHEYLRAWRLGGENSGSTYQGFVQGFSTTERDSLTILSVSGNVVKARVAALQTNGTVRIYQGTYTVHRGVITGFNIRQVS